MSPMPEPAGRVGPMIVAAGVGDLPAGTGPLFVVVGVFDGIHLGHRYLLEALVRESRGRAALATVITFDHHPDEILHGSAPPLLCDPAERLELLAAAGVGATIVWHFDDATRMTPFDAFVRRIADRAPLAGFLMTPDSAFGHERGGTPDAVRALGLDLGFDTVVIPALELAGRPVRSTEIRAAIGRGDVAGAAALLGRPYAVVGEARRYGDSTHVSFPMPVALPASGSFPVMVSAPGVGPRSGWARVGPDRDLVLEGVAAAAGRVRLEFGPDSPR